jgi:uncharacterized protein (TIGR03086 family)
MPDLVEKYAATTRWIRGSVVAIRPEQLHDPTPCTEWDVEALLDHIVATVRGYTTIATDGRIDYEHMRVPDLAGRVVAAYDENVAAALAAWGRPGVLDEPCEHVLGPMTRGDALAFHHADLLVHGWDLRVATGQDATIDPDAAAIAFEAMTSVTPITPEVRAAGAFAAELVVDPAAPPAERLLAFCGRTPRPRA